MVRDYRRKVHLAICLSPIWLSRFRDRAMVRAIGGSGDRAIWSGSRPLGYRWSGYRWSGYCGLGDRSSGDRGLAYVAWAIGWLGARQSARRAARPAQRQRADGRGVRRLTS